MKYVSADEAVRLVRSGDTVVCQGGTSVPVILQEALARRHAELEGVQIVCGFNVTAGEAPFCKPEYKDSFLVNSIFISGDQRKHIAAGYGTMTPAFLGEVPGLFRRGEIPVDVAFINCSLPDKDGKRHEFDVLAAAKDTISGMKIMDPKVSGGAVLFGQLAPFYTRLKEDLMDHLR